MCGAKADLVRAKSGHAAPTLQSYSITSSARLSSVGGSAVATRDVANWLFADLTKLVVARHDRARSSSQST